MKAFHYARRLTTNKTLEVEFQDNPWSWFNFNISLSTEVDHAGFKIVITILKKEFYLNIHDNRHWNYDKDRYMTKEDYEKERDEYEPHTDD